jgi:hypothetical protein
MTYFRRNHHLWPLSPEPLVSKDKQPESQEERLRRGAPFDQDLPASISGLDRKALLIDDAIFLSLVCSFGAPPPRCHAVIISLSASSAHA